MAPDALEKLVSAAEGCNADFAKANFDFYWSKPEERRSLHEMFKPKDCGKPVHPSDTTQFFKQKPSIWSAVYRRDFLERNGIKFLPTPGASFQDTSFAFKVIARRQGRLPARCRTFVSPGQRELLGQFFGQGLLRQCRICRDRALDPRGLRSQSRK